MIQKVEGSDQKCLYDANGKRIYLYYFFDYDSAFIYGSYDLWTSSQLNNRLAENTSKTDAIYAKRNWLYDQNEAGKIDGIALEIQLNRLDIQILDTRDILEQEFNMFKLHYQEKVCERGTI